MRKIEVIEGRVCGKCKNWKPSAEFSRDKRRIGGLGNRCKECVRTWQQANKDRLKKNKTAWMDLMRATPELLEKHKAYHRGHAKKQRE